MKKALMYSRRLKDVGLSQEQAEVHIGILEEIVEDEMATKADLQNLKFETLNAISSLESRIQISIQALDGKISALEQESGFMMKAMEQRILIKMGVMQIASISVMLAFIKLMI